MLVRNGNFLKMRVIEIRVKRICDNQGLGDSSFLAFRNSTTLVYSRWLYFLELPTYSTFQVDKVMANGTLEKYIAILCTSHKSKGIYSKALDKFNSLLSCTRLSDFWKSVGSKMFAR